MDTVRWGIIGCGDVAEVKSGPGFQKAAHSTLRAVTRRDRAKAEDFASRHGVPVVHASAAALISDPDIDAVYIATPPSSHCALALDVAAARKACLVEKPMAIDHPECVRMVEAFRVARRPLWVAYYRRALPRFQLVRRLLSEGAIGRVTSVQVQVFDRLATGEQANAWRFDTAVAGAGPFFDLASHSVDLIDFLLGRIDDVSGFATNTGGSYAAEDVTSAAFHVESGAVGAGIWNFNAGHTADEMRIAGTTGQLTTSVFADVDVVVMAGGKTHVHEVRNPPHVHQPLIQSIVDELRGTGRCASTADSGARASWVLDRCVERYYAHVARRTTSTSQE